MEKLPEMQCLKTHLLSNSFCESDSQVQISWELLVKVSHGLIVVWGRGGDGDGGGRGRHS